MLIRDSTPAAAARWLGVMAIFFSAASPTFSATGATFLEIPVGTRPAALGGAYSSQAADAYAPVWNPAGLGFLTAPEIAGQHLSYLESIHYEYVGVVVPLGKGGLGFSGQYLGSGDLIGQSNTGTPTGTFSSHYGAYSAAYGLRVGEHVALGVTGKWIEAKLADVSADTFGFDTGALWRPNSLVSMAATVSNMGGDLKFIDEGDALPLVGKLGLGYRPARPWLFLLEGAFPRTLHPSAHLGVEWQPIEVLALRAGYRTDTVKELSPVAGVTTGIGLRLRGCELSYAFQPYDDLGGTHSISLSVRLGSSAAVHLSNSEARP